MSDVTRSMDATFPRAAAGAARRRLTMPSGWWGMALLIVTEATLFGALIAAYFYLRFRAHTWPLGGIEKPSVTLPLVFTGMLVATGLPIYAMVRSARLGNLTPARLMLALATAVQATYLGLQIHLFTSDLQDFRPDDNAYGSIYYTLLAVHHAHVAVGLVLSVWLLAKLMRGMTNYRLIALRAIAFYWYFVILAGILVTFTTLYPSF